MQLPRVIVGLAVVALGSHPAPVRAFSSGVTTSFFATPALGCNNCHMGGNDPIVEVVGPEFVRPLSTHEYTVRIGVTGAQINGGFNVKASAGTLTTGGKYVDQTQIMSGEATHQGRKPAKGGYTSFSFLWTAPAVFTTATLDAWGNGVDGNNSSSNDKAAFESFTAGNGKLNACSPAPGSCLTAAKSTFAMTDSADDTKDAVTFAWNKGPLVTFGDLGDPTVSTDYYMCIYKAGSLIAAIDVPGVTTCGDDPCWKLKGTPPTAVLYKNKLGAPSGAKSIKLSSGVAGKSKVSLKAKGIDLPDPAALPIGLTTVVVELHNTTTSVCFGDSYSGAELAKDDGVKLKAKAVNP